MNKKITFLLIIFLILDACYSFYQFYYLPHDGDMAAVIVPAEWYSQVLEDPFGLSVFTKGEKYSGINRFFAHWSLGAYFKTVPLALQLFVKPIESSYLASALARIGTQLLLVWLLATGITGSGNFRKPGFILAAALVVPLFQFSGAFYRMSIMDASITYTFFYEMSVALLMLFFLPFFRAFYLKRDIRLNPLQHILLLVLATTLPLHGPLNAPLALIICPSVLLYLWWKNFRNAENQSFFTRAFQAIFRIPKPVLFYLIYIVLVSLYSFYVGTFNAENDYSVPVGERYNRMLTGLNQQLFFGQGNAFGPAYSLILLVLIINSVLLWKHHPAGKRKVKLLVIALIFCCIYIALLPLGGYRSYRPFIIAGNTFLPVTLTLVYFFGLTSWFILQNLTFSLKKVYVAGLVLLALVFSSTERPEKDSYTCQKTAIEQIASSPMQHVELDVWCGVMSWGKITNPYFSVPPGKLLQHWNVTKDAKTYTTGKQPAAKTVTF